MSLPVVMALGRDGSFHITLTRRETTADMACGQVGVEYVFYFTRAEGLGFAVRRLCPACVTARGIA